MNFSVFIASTLDGFIARPDGSFDFLESVERPGEDYGYAEFMKTVDVLVVGRSTYDVVLAMPAWPWQDKRVVVLTTRPAEARPGVSFHNGPLSELKQQLAAEGLKHAYVDGGRVIQQGLDADVIDDLTISLIPMRLGAGIPLFGTGVERRFTVTGTKAFPSGLVQLKLGRAP